MPFNSFLYADWVQVTYVFYSRLINNSRYQGEDEDNLKPLENNANRDDGGGGVVETKTRKRGIKKGTGLWDQLDMDWIKSQIPFMHPKTKMHTFRLKHCLCIIPN